MARRLRPTIVALTLGSAVAVAASAFFADWNTLLGTYVAAAGLLVRRRLLRRRISSGISAARSSSSRGFPSLAVALGTLEWRPRPRVPGRRGPRRHRRELGAGDRARGRHLRLEAGLRPGRAGVARPSPRRSSSSSGCGWQEGRRAPSRLTSVLALLLVNPAATSSPWKRSATQEGRRSTRSPPSRSGGCAKSTSLDTVPAELQPRRRSSDRHGGARPTPRTPRAAARRRRHPRGGCPSSPTRERLDRLTKADRTWVFGTTDTRWIDHVRKPARGARHLHSAQHGHERRTGEDPVLERERRVWCSGCPRLHTQARSSATRSSPGADGVMSDADGAPRVGRLR